jgi:hypothetical protein
MFMPDPEIFPFPIPDLLTTKTRREKEWTFFVLL